LTGTEDKYLKRKICFGVSKRPCLHIPPEKQTFVIIHGPHGINTHFKKHTIDWLRAIDIRNGNFLQRMEDINDELEEYQTQSKEFKEKQKENKKFAVQIQRLKAAIKNPNQYQQVEAKQVEALKEKLRVVREQRIEQARDSGLANLVKLRKGAGILSKELTKYLLSSSKKPRGEAEFVFLKAVEIYGDNFQAEHGGFELTHGDGIDMLEEWEMICKLKMQTYADNATSRSEVQEAMDDTKIIAFHFIN
jgi:AAA15 family ATPase/GTPase